MILQQYTYNNGNQQNKISPNHLTKSFQCPEIYKILAR